MVLFYTLGQTEPKGTNVSLQAQEIQGQLIVIFKGQAPKSRGWRTEGEGEATLDEVGRQMFCDFLLFYWVTHQVVSLGDGQLSFQSV